MQTIAIVSKVSESQRHIINLVVTRSLLARLLGYPIKRIEVWAHVIWVLPEKGRPRFISKSFVWNGFRESRRRNAQSLKVLPPRHKSELATVMNPNNNSVYAITLSQDGKFPVCECMDYYQQAKVMGPRWSVCKHIFAYKMSLNQA